MHDDDGRWAVDNGVGSWMLLREGVYEPHAAAELHEPGWREAVVLTPTDADAQRLAVALHRRTRDDGASVHDSYVRTAWRVLNRLMWEQR